MCVVRTGGKFRKICQGLEEMAWSVKHLPYECKEGPEFHPPASMFVCLKLDVKVQAYNLNARDI